MQGLVPEPEQFNQNYWLKDLNIVKYKRNHSFLLLELPHSYKIGIYTLLEVLGTNTSLRWCILRMSVDHVSL
jgi:hypothetical protein